MEKRLRWLGEGRLYRVWPEDLWQRLLCRVFGHDQILDQCGLPEHAYCAWCQKHMPIQRKDEDG